MGTRSMKSVYYDTKNIGSFGGVERLRRSTLYKRSDVKKFLQSQDTYTLHKPVRRKFRRRRVIVGGIKQQFQADLVDVRNLKAENDNVSYLLTAIDVFSKYAYVIPLLNKTSSTVLNAFKALFPSRSDSPLYIQTDLGSEFKNKAVQTFFKSRGIDFFVSNNRDIKASIVERFNRTLQNRIYRYLTKTNTNRYIDVLQNLVKNYNNSYHRSIKCSPSEVNTSNQEKVWQTLYDSPSKTISDIFPEGARVRISKTRAVFDKGYLPSWTQELFTISNILHTRPITYKVKDDNGELLEGSFYNHELQQVADKEVYQISRIIKTRRAKGRREYLVEWYGYPESFNSWISAGNFEQYE